MAVNDVDAGRGPGSGGRGDAVAVNDVDAGRGPGSGGRGDAVAVNDVDAGRGPGSGGPPELRVATSPAHVGEATPWP